MIAIGDRVRLRHDVDRYPHFVAPAGSTGTVTVADVVPPAGDYLVMVKMDETIAGAEEWDNEVQWFDGCGDAADDLEVIGKDRRLERRRQEDRLLDAILKVST